MDVPEPSRRRPRRRRLRRAALGVAPTAVAAVLVVLFTGSLATPFARLAETNVAWRREAHPQRAWVPCNRHAGSNSASTFRPLSDAAAAALVTREPETRSDNARPFTVYGQRHVATTEYVPTNQQLARFRAARTSNDQPVLRFNPYLRYVNGRDGIRHPSTDDLIQWAAHKWGIPENWLRAEYVQESYWNMFQLGDVEPESAADVSKNPRQARVPGGREVYQSLGITQVRWTPEGTVGAGTNPLRWESLAFNVDYQAAMLRFYYDNPDGARSAWGDTSYRPCERWGALGAWFSAYPFNNDGAQHYIALVKHNLATRAWRSSDFLAWAPSSLPPGVVVR